MRLFIGLMHPQVLDFHLNCLSSRPSRRSLFCQGIRHLGFEGLDTFIDTNS
jgi:hypothetical protein